MSNKKKWIFASILLFVIIVFSVGMMEYAVMKSKKIISGVSINQVNVGHMNRDQFQEILTPLYQKSMEREIVIKGGGNSWSFSPSQLGVKEDMETTIHQAWLVGRTGPLWQRWFVRWKANKQNHQLSLAFKVEESQLTQKVAEMAQMVDKEPKNAGVFVKNDHQVEIIPGINGLKVNIEESLKALRGVLVSDNKRESTLVIQLIQPALTEQVVKSWNINGVVARHETLFDPAKEDRSANIKMAAMALDHILVMPQQIFSFNEIVGPRTTEAGYKESLVIENNEFTPGIGGGVCQVSTTLYNAILKSNLPIIERHPHSLPISYVQPGMDATVSYNWADLKFINDREKPILIHTEYQKGKIKVLIFATLGEFSQVKLSSKVIRYLEAEQEIIKDPSLPPGRTLVEEKGHRGMVVEVYRELISEDGVLTRELISRDKYKPTKSVIRVPAES